MRQIMRAGLLIFLTCTLATGCDRGTLSDQIGRTAPVFSINDGEHAVDLQSLQGKVVVLNFWASWCAPCVEEMPSLQAFQQQMPQVQVVAVASNEAFANYQHYVARQHINLLTVFDQNQTSNKLYGSFKFPETYIIDKRGIIRRKLIGPQDFTSPGFLKYIQKLNS
ncbi:MAG TPA: TlpA disulfide reductase family protein [Acidobacteriaceae bacterium]|jgi:cytochrome c biogenesis protein CcmG/thiol:disulfide interchange protein DsbE|nr:TlpA disulfide reductase family protein [Acidobacteriaceae bacterium]